MRERLISVAIEQFGERGFSGASTRDIAAAADTTMSNITYHFGGKQGLYRAAAEAIVTRFATVLGEPTWASPADDASREERITMICSMLRKIGTFMLSEEAKPLARFVAREQQDSDSVMRDCFEREIRPMTDGLRDQVAALRPDLGDVDLTSTVFYILTMAISLRTSRLSLCIFLDVGDIDEALSKQLLDRLEASAREILEVQR